MLTEKELRVCSSNKQYCTVNQGHLNSWLSNRPVSNNRQSAFEAQDSVDFSISAGIVMDNPKSDVDLFSFALMFMVTLVFQNVRMFNVR